MEAYPPFKDVPYTKGSSLPGSISPTWKNVLPKKTLSLKENFPALEGIVANPPIKEVKTVYRGVYPPYEEVNLPPRMLIFPTWKLTFPTGNNYYLAHRVNYPTYKNYYAYKKVYPPFKEVHLPTRKFPSIQGSLLS